MDDLEGAAVGESLEFHARNVLNGLSARTEYLLMPANGVFALGVGHVRRKRMEPGEKTDEPAVMMTTVARPTLPRGMGHAGGFEGGTDARRKCAKIHGTRAERAGVTHDRFYEIAEGLDEKKVIGRFSTFLEHVKPSEAGTRVTRFNGLFHWAVPKGREIEAGGEVGRHHLHDPCLLARGRAAVWKCEHHGSHARDGETEGSGAQGGHRPASGERWGSR